MAKSGFWLRGSKGKLAGTVLYQSQGSTIQREIVTPKNPQSDNQMRQRAAFAGASKFYQNAQQNRFVLAFQNKKGNQSEFNAFMQKNLREFDTLTFPTKEQANTPEFCNYFPWICTEGNLQGIPAVFPDDGMAALGCGVFIDTSTNTWDDLIALNSALNLQYGDIITLTVVVNDEVFNDTTHDVIVGNITPRWITRQFVIGADLGGYTLLQYFQINGLRDNVSIETGDVCLGINMDEVCDELGFNGGVFDVTEVAAMICVTRSRNEGSQLKVSTSRFALDDMAQRIFQRLSNDTQMRDAIESYKNTSNSNITPANVLQGSAAENNAVKNVRYTPSDSTSETIVSAPASGLSVKVTTAEGKDTATVIIYGDEDLVASKVSAAATGYTVSTAKVTIYLGKEPGAHSLKTVEGRKITFTRNSTTADSITFQVKYSGVTVATGNIVKSA